MMKIKWGVYSYFRTRFQSWSEVAPKDESRISLKDLHLPWTHCVKNQMLPTFKRILDCFKLGERFHPNSFDNREGNQQMTISLDSYKVQIIADGMESGLSVRRVWENVNCRQRENADEVVSQSCICYALRKMKPKIVNIHKRKQGSSTRDDVPPPDQLVGWDKLQVSHWRAESIQMLFPREKEEKIDVGNGEYTNQSKTILNVKYNEEWRLGFGVGMVTLLGPDGTLLSSKWSTLMTTASWWRLKSTKSAVDPVVILWS